MQMREPAAPSAGRPWATRTGAADHPEGVGPLDRPAVFYSDGLKLAATIHSPGGGRSERRPAVVLCQGFGSPKEINLPVIAEHLAGRGYVAMLFDYRGWGASEGTRSRIVPLEQVQDIRNALSFLEGQEEVDAQRLGLFGVSFGAANAVYTAGADARVRCTIAAVGFGDGDRWMRSMRRLWEYQELRARLAKDRVTRAATGKSETVDSGVILVRDPESARWHEETLRRFPERRSDLTLETADRILEFRPERMVPLIAPRAVMFVAAGRDTICDPAESVRMYELASEPRALATLDGVEHHAIYGGEPFVRMMGEVDPFLARHL